MSKLLRRPTRSIACFYCQAEQQPRDPRSFRCRECACWNRYDKDGEIMSDDPAMHDESLNARSFARRASPRKDRLPSMYPQREQSLFCHACQTNQMLIANLLSNYLPAVDDPDHTRLLAQLPAYQASLETRYPPICANCLPAVEDEIKRRDDMARTSALGRFLKDTKGKGKQRQTSVSQGQKEALERQLVIWKLRGALWGISIAIVMTAYGIMAAGYGLPPVPAVLINALPFLALLSIAWTAWDPTYASLKRSQLQGREVRQRGKKEYNILQSLVWLGRLVTASVIVLSLHIPSWDLLQLTLQGPTFVTSASPVSTRTIWYFRVSLALEIIILARSLFVLRIDRPPSVRLMQQYSHRPSTVAGSASSRQSTPSLESPPDMFSTLTLSNKPILPGYLSNIHDMTGADGRSRPNTPNPVFGMPSLASAAHISEPNEANGDNIFQDTGAMDEEYDPFEDDNDDADADGEEEKDPNAMDWSPIAPANRRPPPRSRKMIRGSNGGPAPPQQQIQRRTGRKDDGSWLRPQRFFVPEEPTGLEGLFEQTISLSDDARFHGAQGKNGKAESEKKWMGWIKGRWRSEA